jgi:hypothetical protein
MHTLYTNSSIRRSQVTPSPLYKEQLPHDRDTQFFRTPEITLRRP